MEAQVSTVGGSAGRPGGAWGGLSLGRMPFYVFSGALAIIFLFLRTFAVEPFGVPTGSMAPTLLGNHREARCPRCGHTIRVGWPQASDWTEMVCPNCGHYQGREVINMEEKGQG